MTAAVSSMRRVVCGGGASSVVWKREKVVKDRRTRKGGKYVRHNHPGTSTLFFGLGDRHTHE